MDLANLIKQAGVVGAGGAGFPTHVKSGSQVEFVLANGAECEPLLHKDYELMLLKAKEMIEGMALMIKSTGAKKGYFGIKTKNAKAIEAVKAAIGNHPIEITELGDFYPSGDEYELVYTATGRLIPAGGIPLNVGCVVNNVETLMNVKHAAEEIPVTEKFICVAGAVKNPSTFFVPVGTTAREVIELAGGSTEGDYAVFNGGLMMGKLMDNLDEPVTKTSGGFIVLPKKHNLVFRLGQPEKNWHRIGKSACDQCSYCTEFCPRYLLGYDVQPHKVMRSLGFTASGAGYWNQMAELCCSCGLCTLYACPEELFPKEACDQSKRQMRTEGVKYVQKHPVKVHPMKEGRRVPLKMLMKKLNVSQYSADTPFIDVNYQPQEVKIKLKQAVGDPSVPVVALRDRVKKGDVIATIPEGKLGSTIHASISGTVIDVNNDFIRILNN